jgi:LDH2 family malate/lactate/ureidoglycolate dehydrogenase
MSDLTNMSYLANMPGLTSTPDLISTRGLISTPGPTSEDESVLVDYDDLLAFASGVFGSLGLPPAAAAAAGEALCYGDLTGLSSHGLANLTRLYLPLFSSGQVDPGAGLTVLADRGASVLADARRALGLWAAGEAMDLAADRAARYGIGMVAVRGATHFGCAGQHAARAVGRGMIGIVASNCGRQRIARPPGGKVAMLGTNPVAVAAPAGDHPPFILDMSTTAVPTGRVRAAARAGTPVPAGWLEDDAGNPVTDPAAFDRGDAHLLWLGASPGSCTGPAGSYSESSGAYSGSAGSYGGASGAYKGFGLGLAVEILAALVPGAGFGPAPEALSGTGGPSGRDDDIGFWVAAIDPPRDPEAVRDDAQALFGALLDCPPVREDEPVRYPGWHEADRARRHRANGVPLPAALYRELTEVAAARGLPSPPPRSPAPRNGSAAPGSGSTLGSVATGNAAPGSGAPKGGAPSARLPGGHAPNGHVSSGHAPKGTVSEGTVSEGTVSEDGGKRPVDGVLVKVLIHRRDDRGMKLEPEASRCVRRGELHELVTTSQSRTEPGTRIDRVGFLGFAEMACGGVIDRGDEVWAGDRLVGTVLGFDACHFPNHYNILVTTDEPRTGLDLALEPGTPVGFRPARAR